MLNFVNDLAEFKTKVICGIASVHKRRDKAVSENFFRRQSGGSNVFLYDIDVKWHVSCSVHTHQLNNLNKKVQIQIF